MEREKLLRHDEEKQRKALRVAQEELARKESAHARVEGELAQFAADKEEAEGALAAFEARVLAEVAQSSSVPVTAADLAEYEQKKKAAYLRSGKEQRTLEERRKRVASEAKVEASFEEERRVMQNRLKEIEARTRGHRPCCPQRTPCVDRSCS